jgi:hypothetical protein
MIRRPFPLLAGALWLAAGVGCGTGGQSDAVAPRPDSSAAQLAFGVRHVLTTAGVRRAELQADTAAFDETGTRVELRRVRLTYFTAAGDTVATTAAPAAEYDLRARRVTARGGASVVTRDGRQLTTQRLTYHAADGRITGDSAYTLVSGGPRRAGVGFDADPGLRTVRAPRPLGAPGRRAR